MKIKISVVIPFYNVEIFAERCIKSVIKQTYKDIEIILVDDGSTDATGYILDKYRNIDSRIKVHHKVNGGLSDARNFGVKQSNGNYITFIDGDDYVSKYYIESLVDGINLGGDISCSQFHIVYEDSKLVEAESKKKGIQIVDEVTAIKCILNRKFQHNAWGKLFPRKYFNDLEFPKGIYYEDMAVIYEILSCAKKVALIKSKDYYYVQRKDSIMNEPFNIKKMDIIKVGQHLEKIIKLEFPELINEMYSRLFSAYSGVWLEMPESKIGLEKENLILWNSLVEVRRKISLSKVRHAKTFVGIVLSYLGEKKFRKIFYLLK